MNYFIKLMRPYSLTYFRAKHEEDLDLTICLEWNQRIPVDHEMGYDQISKITMGNRHQRTVE